MPSNLGLTRDNLREIRNRMVQASPTCSAPKDFLRQYSDAVDGWVRTAFHKAQSQGSPSSVCLMAVGGYGRSELAPYSDIDLLILYSPSQKVDLPPLIEKTLYPLWDLGLDVSCSSRTIDECLGMAKSDVLVKTGLLDGRYLDGNYDLFRTFHGLFTKKILHRNVRQFAETLARDIHLRHQKYEDPAYVLEPNIKEGKGGLRDFQAGRWIIRAKYQTDRWDSILFPDQSRTIDRSFEFLLKIRNELHVVSQRRQDDLTFELQEKIAPVLGFSTGHGGIEEMMRSYHLSIQRISGFVNDVLDRTLLDTSAVKRFFLFFKTRKVNECFKRVRGELTLIDPVTFKKDPSEIMALFRHCQVHRLRMDFRTEESVLEALPFIDDRFRSSSEVNDTFRSILRQGHGAGSLLQKMHELGVLSHYIPEFSEIQGKVHHDLYHVHPVDTHSILAVEELEKVRNGHYQAKHPLLTSSMGGIDKPEILMLTALLHDIGKGVDGNHSITGATLARAIGTRLGLSTEEVELMVFLVSHHLFMLETALRRDLHDEQAIFRFAHDVGHLDRLKMLYLLTFADVKAVGPEAWTDWKDSLLAELFLKASHLIEGNRVLPALPSEDDLTRTLKERFPPDLVSEVVQHLPSRYLSSFSQDQVIGHLRMAQALDKQSLSTEWTIKEDTQATITLCTRDRYGLFSKIAGSMFVNRLNILEAQIHTWGNGVALDTFRVEDRTGEIQRRLEQFTKHVEGILSGELSMKGLLAQQETSNGTLKKVLPGVLPEVKINNQDSDFYTIVEVVGEDRLGALYELTQALTDHGCDIHFSRISTLGNRIIDVFYVQDSLGEKIEGQDEMASLKQTLLNCLSSKGARPV
jgi:[protein-PII] uridylyltransferase